MIYFNTDTDMYIADRNHKMQIQSGKKNRNQQRKKKKQANNV